MPVIKKIKKAMQEFFEKWNPDIKGARQLDELLLAAETGDMKALKKYLKKTRPGPPGPLAEWMLFAAASNGQEKAVRFLLDNGVPPDAQSLTNQYAVEEARANGHAAVTAMLEDALREKWSPKPGEDEETFRLDKIRTATDYRFNVSVTLHFTRTGKDSEFDAAVRQEDQERLTTGRSLSRPAINKSMDFLRLEEVFVRAARRVEDDQKLASMLPPLNFEERDAEILDGKKLTSLAALVRARLEYQKRRSKI